MNKVSSYIMDSTDHTRNSRSFRILMFPWLAHGHISPFLELAKSLSSRNFTTYICSSPINLDSIKPKLSHKDAISIKLVELHIPTTPDLPPHHHTTNGLPPHLMPHLKRALNTSRPAFSKLLDTLKPDLLIYDFLQPWGPEEAASRDIPGVVFLTTGAASTSFLMHHIERTELEYPFPGMYFRESEYRNFTRFVECGETNDDQRLKNRVEGSCDIVLIKTFGELEKKYIDFVSNLTRKKLVPTGPLVQSPLGGVENEQNDVVQWLHRKEEGSTVFASFGSEYFLTDNEMEEIAHGLELSMVNFVWVVRFPVGENVAKIEEKLPLGFLERVGERGKVVEGWAPQRRILSHRSVGGFLSHCGWSSVMEGVYYGVPFIAVPMHLDQPLNARLVEEVGIGEEVVRSRDGKLDQDEVARVVKKVMIEGGNGEGLRRRVEEVSMKMREEGEKEIDGVAEGLVRLCLRTKRLGMLSPTKELKNLVNVNVNTNREGVSSA